MELDGCVCIAVDICNPPALTQYTSVLLTDRRGAAIETCQTFTLATSRHAQTRTWPTGSAGSANKKLGAVKPVADVCCSLPWRSDQVWCLAEGVGSAFCPLTLSRRLRLFAPPALPVTRARARSAPTHVTEHGEAGLLQRTIASDATYAWPETASLAGGRLRAGRRGSHCVRGHGAIDAVSRIVELVRGGNPASPWCGVRSGANGPRGCALRERTVGASWPHVRHRVNLQGRPRRHRRAWRRT